MGIGSGVVYDSVGAKEYDECLLKMKFLTDPPKTFELIETLLWERDKGFWLVERHFDRVAASARYFLFQVRRGSSTHGAGTGGGNGWAGASAIARAYASGGGWPHYCDLSSDAAPGPDAVMRYVVSPTRLDSSDAFFFHKTTRRELYDRSGSSTPRPTARMRSSTSTNVENWPRVAARTSLSIGGMACW